MKCQKIIMKSICKRCKKQDLAKYMTGFKNFYFCDKCENKGIAEEMLKDFEKQTKGKMSEKERAYNLKSFEKMLLNLLGSIFLFELSDTSWLSIFLVSTFKFCGFLFNSFSFFK